MSCSNCGQANAPDAAFCDNCGYRLTGACPACGTENRPDARFCRSCGASLLSPDASGPGTAAAAAAAGASGPVGAAGPAGAAAPLAERRLVSVLFADLVAFTTYAEGRDPETVRDMLSRYFEAVREVIERHGGSVEKFIGDAVMAAWGTPRANEDDAERAVRAGLGVIEAVAGLDAGLEARVGVLTGQAAVTVGATDQGMVAGDLVNTAARLQSVAAPGSVLVGEATMLAAASAVTFEPAGAHVLRGKEAPIPAWRALRVTGDRGGRSRSDALEPPFVGRELELRLLKDLLHAMGQERRPRLVSITGPAGIGKSRLAWELQKYVDGLVEDVYWHRGRAPSYGEGVTFWALGEMVRRRAGLVEGDAEATTRERIRETVAEHVSDAEDRAWVEPALLALLGVEPPPAGGRDRLFAAWRIFFERIARHGTTVLLFEDMQWADGGQLDFIDHLLEWSRDVPILVITLARPELLERRPGWGTSARSFNAVGLEPLSDQHMRQLLLGLVPELPDAAVRSVLERADGIPLYAVETVRMLIADGRLVSDDGATYQPTGTLGELAIPDTLRALVASRLDALEAVDRSLLQDASVLGKTFTPQALASVAGLQTAALGERLRGLVRREILEIAADPRSPERGQYGFVQSVIREVAYETLARRERRARHLAAARYFESHGDEELAGVLATHYLAAHQASDPGVEADALQVQARRALRAAADRAVTLGAADQAMVCLRQALDITDAAAERGDLLERAAEAADIEARYDEAEELARRAMDAYAEAGDRSSVARVSALLGTILADASKLLECVAFLQEAVAASDAPDDVVARADMLARLSRAHMRLGQDEEAVRRADEALAIAEPRRLDAVIAEAFINKGASLNALGRLREPILLVQAAVELASRIGDIALELRARNNLATVIMPDDVVTAQTLILEAYRLSSRVGMRQMTLWLVGTNAYAAMFAGTDWDTPLAMVDAELERQLSSADRARLLGIRELAMTWRGEDTSAIARERRQVGQTVSDPDVAAWSVMLPGLAELVAGRPDRAIEPFRRSIPLTAQNAIDSWIGLIRAACAARDLETALEGLRAAEAEPYTGRYVDGVRALARAGVAALEGRSDASLDDFSEAVETFDRMGARFDAALARLAALDVLPDEPAIAGWASEARTWFETVRSPALLARLDEAVAVRTG